MAKSRSESPVPSAFPLLSLRGAEGDVAISRVRQGKRTVPSPGRKLLRGAEIPRFTRNKLRNLTTGSLK
jgi:hypothetical protein